MTETQQIDLAIGAIERRKDRLQRRAVELTTSSMLSKDQRLTERTCCLNQVEALEWAIGILREGGIDE